MPPRKGTTPPPSPLPNPEGISAWDGENHKDGFHFDPLTDEQMQQNIAGVHAAKAAMHVVAPDVVDFGATQDVVNTAESSENVANPERFPHSSESKPREDITKKRMAISRLLALLAISPEQRGVVISEAAIKAAEPSNLAKHLFGDKVIVSDRTKGVGKQAALYKKPDGKWQAVALSARERKLLKSNVQAYADAPYLTTKASESYNAEHDPAAPTRAVYHSLDDSIVPKMEVYVGTLLNREEILRQFNEALTPGRYGLARMGSEATMRGNASILFDQILPDALDAIGDQKQWTFVQARLAYATIMHRVTATDAGGRRDFKYTRRLVNMLRTHNTQKIALYRNSIETGKAYSALHHQIAADQAAAGKVQ